MLSISKALSIQAHPDKALAENLHRKFPSIYKDANHMPEMAIALTPFEALSGFRTVSVVKNHLKNYPELRELIEDSIVEEFLKSNGPFVKEALRKLFSCLMKRDEKKISENVNKLVNRLSSSASKNSNDELILRLNGEYPGDVGCFCVLLLNYVKLNPMEAFYMGPNEPHAYLKGECLECMATSDNVVRAGLTPKFKDVDVLCSMLTYECTDPQDQLLKPSKFGNYSSLYAPPIAEFSVLTASIQNKEIEKYEPIPGPSIFLCLKGEGTLRFDGSSYQIKMGSALFIPCNISLEFETSSSLLFAMAFCSCK